MAYCSGHTPDGIVGTFVRTSYGIAGLLMLAVSHRLYRGKTERNVWRWSPACWLLFRR